MTSRRDLRPRRSQAHRRVARALERDDFSPDRQLALTYPWSMILSENRRPPRINSGAGFFGIMLSLQEQARGSGPCY